jgi:hypothetical protein
MGQGGAAVCTRPTRRSMWIGECRWGPACTTQGDKMFRAGGNTTPGESVGRMWSSEVPNEWRTGRDFEWRTTPGRPSWLSRGGGGKSRLTSRLDMRAGGKADREDWRREGLLVPTGLAAGRMRNQSRTRHQRRGYIIRRGWIRRW